MSPDAFQATAYQEEGPGPLAGPPGEGGPPPPAAGAPPPAPEPPPPAAGGPPPAPAPVGSPPPPAAEAHGGGPPAPPAPSPSPPAPAGPAEPAASPSPASAPGVTGPRRVIGAILLSYQDDVYGKHWLLHDGDNLVGRAETNVKVEVPIAHGTTSTRHAAIRCSDEEVTVTDMKSTNGTYHNGRRITANNPVKVRSGDKLRFGGYSVYVFFAPNRQ